MSITPWFLDEADKVFCFSSKLSKCWNRSRMASCTVQQLCGPNGMCGHFIRLLPPWGASPVLVVAFVFVLLKNRILIQWAIGVCGFVGGVAVGVADRWMGAGWTLLVCRDGAWVIFRLVGLRTDSVVGGIMHRAAGCT